jgi:hypothetical protein
MVFSSGPIFLVSVGRLAQSDWRVNAWTLGGKGIERGSKGALPRQPSVDWLSFRGASTAR